MDVKIGSVVRETGKTELLVVVDEVNYEDVGSCSLARDFYVMPLDELLKIDHIPVQAGRKIEARGQMPLETVEGEAPFELTKQSRYQVRRMTPRTITIYE